MVWGHHHHHRRSLILRAQATVNAHAGTEVRGGDNQRHASRNMSEDASRQYFAFLIRENELLGEVCENAEALRPRVDHEIDAAFLARQIEFSRFCKRGWD